MYNILVQEKMKLENEETHSIFAQVIKKYVEHKYKLFKEEYNNDNIA